QLQTAIAGDLRLQGVRRKPAVLGGVPLLSAMPQERIERFEAFVWFPRIEFAGSPGKVDHLVLFQFARDHNGNEKDRFSAVPAVHTTSNTRLPEMLKGRKPRRVSP